MRRIAIALTLFLSACATAPQQTAQPLPVQPAVADRAGLVGLSAAQLLSKLGPPALQIREGTSLKLQFRNSRCVIDAYLYPQGRGQPDKVEHVDTRAPSGVDANEQLCVDLFQSKAN
jgi:hypothetical protein